MSDQRSTNPGGPMEFKDISMEQRRTYLLKSGNKVTIEEPLTLRVSEGGTHYVATKDRLHIVAPFDHIAIDLRSGKPVAFSF